MRRCNDASTFKLDREWAIYNNEFDYKLQLFQFICSMNIWNIRGVDIRNDDQFHSLNTIQSFFGLQVIQKSGVPVSTVH